jgi:hypothetical protein
MAVATRIYWRSRQEYLPSRPAALPTAVLAEVSERSPWRATGIPANSPFVSQGKLPTLPIIATLGISLVDAARAPLHLRGFSGRMAIQYLGTGHGGWLLALLDSALGCAVQIVQPGVCGFTTLDLHVRFVAVEQVEYKRQCESRALLTIPG